MFKQLCVLKDYSMKELQIKNCFPLINSTVAMAGRKIVSHNSHAYPTIRTPNMHAPCYRTRPLSVLL